MEAIINVTKRCEGCVSQAIHNFGIDLRPAASKCYQGVNVDQCERGKGPFKAIIIIDNFLSSQRTIDMALGMVVTTRDRRWGSWSGKACTELVVWW